MKPYLPEEKINEKKSPAEQPVLVSGVGRIGSLITCLLAGSSDYKGCPGKLKLDAAHNGVMSNHEMRRMITSGMRYPDRLPITRFNI